MLTQQLIETLRQLKLTGMADALDLQLSQPATHDALAFEERLGLLLEREVTHRDNRRVERLLVANGLEIVHPTVDQVPPFEHVAARTLLGGHEPTVRSAGVALPGVLGEALPGELLEGTSDVV